MVVAQATFKNKHRQDSGAVSFVQFWWVQTSIQSRAKRLRDRSVRWILLPGSMAASSQWCDDNDKNFEAPSDRIGGFANNSDCASEAGKQNFESCIPRPKMQGARGAVNIDLPKDISMPMNHTGTSH